MTTDAGTPLVPYSQDAAELANVWCFRCRRRKYGTCADYPGDIALMYQTMLDVGFTKAELMAETEKPCGLPPLKRDLAEYFWQFKKRMEFIRFGDPKAKGKPPETPEQLAAKRRDQIRRREQAAIEDGQRLTSEQVRGMLGKRLRKSDPAT